MYSAVSTLGTHVGGTKFYEVVLLCNVINHRCVVIRRNGKASSAAVRGGGQCQLLYAGHHTLAVEIFNEKVSEKKEYPLLKYAEARTVGEICELSVDEIKFLLSDYGISIPFRDEFWSVDADCEQPVIQAVKSELPKTIPAHYGGW